MSQVELNIKEMQNFLTHIVTNNRHIQSQGKIPAAVEIVGESGLGKTSLALQMGKDMNLHVVKLNLAQIEELGDLIGFPIKEFELCKENVSGETAKATFVKEMGPDGKPTLRKVEATSERPGCVWVDEHSIKHYTEMGYSPSGRKRTSYCPPEWIAGKEAGGILILDDWNRADIRFIQAVMELVDRQTYISWKLPKDWHIFLTANPDDGEYLVNAIDVAQRTRFISTILKWDAKCWAEWAENNVIDGRCINFVLLNPEMITQHKIVNPRSITTFFNCISSLQDFNSEESLLMIEMIGNGSVGPEVANLFASFIHNKLDKLISPEDMLGIKSEETVDERLGACINQDGKPRTDISVVLGTRLMNYALAYAEKNPVSQDMIDRLIFLIKSDHFSIDMKFAIVKRLIARNKQKFQKIIVDKTVQDYATK